MRPGAGADRVASQARRSVEALGITHTNPVPAASQIGPFLASGALTGRDPLTGQMPDRIEAQMVNVFQQVRDVMAAAGGTTDDVLKLTVHLEDPGDRSALNEQWLTLYPDPSNRPARQVLAARLDGPALVHCNLLAVLQVPATAPATTDADV